MPRKPGWLRPLHARYLSLWIAFEGWRRFPDFCSKYAATLRWRRCVSFVSPLQHVKIGASQDWVSVPFALRVLIIGLFCCFGRLYWSRGSLTSIILFISSASRKHPRRLGPSFVCSLDHCQLGSEEHIRRSRVLSISIMRSISIPSLREVHSTTLDVPSTLCQGSETLQVAAALQALALLQGSHNQHSSIQQQARLGLLLRRRVSSSQNSHTGG